MITRRKTRPIKLGKLKVGGDAPITVQSMTKTDTRDVEATLLQIWALEAAGCEIVRCAVPVREAAEKLGEIKRQIRIPLVADIHFNYKLALIALEQGVDGLRRNGSSNRWERPGARPADRCARCVHRSDECACGFAARLAM